MVVELLAKDKVSRGWRCFYKALCGVESPNWTTIVREGARFITREHTVVPGGGADIPSIRASSPRASALRRIEKVTHKTIDSLPLKRERREREKAKKLQLVNQWPA